MGNQAMLLLGRPVGSSRGEEPKTPRSSLAGPWSGLRLVTGWSIGISNLSMGRHDRDRKDVSLREEPAARRRTQLLLGEKSSLTGVTAYNSSENRRDESSSIQSNAQLAGHGRIVATQGPNVAHFYDKSDPHSLNEVVRHGVWGGGPDPMKVFRNSGTERPTPYQHRDVRRPKETTPTPDIYYRIPIEYANGGPPVDGLNRLTDTFIAYEQHNMQEMSSRPRSAYENPRAKPGMA